MNEWKKKSTRHLEIIREKQKKTIQHKIHTKHLPGDEQLIN